MDTMEKDQGTSAPEMAAPLYPGPPMDTSSGFNQPQPGAQPAYQYNPQQPQVIQVVNQEVTTPLLPSDIPGQMECPHCKQTVITQVKRVNGLTTWMMCVVMGLFLCCCWIPFCVKAFKDVEHSCPNCKKVLHIHKRNTEGPYYNRARRT